MADDEAYELCKPTAWDEYVTGLAAVEHEHGPKPMDVDPQDVDDTLDELQWNRAGGPEAIKRLRAIIAERIVTDYLVRIQGRARTKP